MSPRNLPHLQQLDDEDEWLRFLLQLVQVLVAQCVVGEHVGQPTCVRAPLRGVLALGHLPQAPRQDGVDTRVLCRETSMLCVPRALSPALAWHLPADHTPGSPPWLTPHQAKHFFLTSTFHAHNDTGGATLDTFTDKEKSPREDKPLAQGHTAWK